MATNLVEAKSESSDLFFQEGNSDKEYHIQLEQSEAGWSVMAQWGRRGSALHDEVKIAGASFEEAKKLYDKTLNSKLKKGYQPSTS